MTRRPGPRTGRLGEAESSTRKPRGKPSRAKAVPGERPNNIEIPPLVSTYDAPRPAGAYFDEEAGERPVTMIESELRHYKGRWVGQPFFLMDWEKRLLRTAFGWMNEDGTRLYRQVYCEAPRKSGKTSLAAGVALYLAHGDEEAAAEIYFAAYDKDQARICYDDARFMTEQSPELTSKTLIYLSRIEMLLKENPGGFMRCLSRDTSKQFGLNMHGLIFDELMTQKSREMWNALTSSQGSREQPMTFCISTAGWDIESICFEQHKRVEAIAAGDAEDPTFLGVIYGAPIDADWTDEEVWWAANPSLGVTASLDFYRQKAIEAKNQPTEQNAFRTLLLSQWVGQAERFIDIKVWDSNDAEPDPPRQRPAFGGLDLSTTTDMTAFVIASERDGKLDIEPHVFLPEANLGDRERRDRAPYRTWAEEGLITLTPGEVVDYRYVKQAVMAGAEAYDLLDVSYDRWNSSQLIVELEEEGLEMMMLGQGFAGLSAPTKELLRLALEGKLRHGGHPVLRWCMNAVAVVSDPAGNVKPDKSKSSQRIDPVVALIMAIDGWFRRGQDLERPSPYSEGDVVVA